MKNSIEKNSDILHKRANANMWLIVHIPKTAGTSLRWAIEKYLGQSNVVRDYGPQGVATSEEVHRHLYSGDETNGPEKLVTEISENSKKVLIGHFPFQKYKAYFEEGNVITFVRNPLLRTCSEYLHRAKNGTFEGSFSEFLQRPKNQNLQSRLLDGISERCFIGLTERFNESMQRVGNATQWKLVTRRKNVGSRGGGRKLADRLSSQELDLFHKLNAEDEEMYLAAMQRFAAYDEERSGPGSIDSLQNNRPAKAPQ